MNAYLMHYAEGSTKKNHKWIDRYRSKTGRWIYVYKNKSGKTVENRQGLDDTKSVEGDYSYKTGLFDSSGKKIDVHDIYVDLNDNIRSSEVFEKESQSRTKATGSSGYRNYYYDYNTGKAVSSSKVDSKAKSTRAKKDFTRIKNSVLKKFSNTTIGKFLGK